MVHGVVNRLPHKKRGDIVTDIEKLAKKIFNECEKDGEPVTMAEAVEMAEMEIKSTKTTQKVTNSVKKERKPRVYVASNEKSAIFNDIYGFLSDNYDVSVITNNKK